METNRIYQGEAKQVLQDMPDQSINTCVTSPPYWGLRDYDVEGQLGLEDTPEEYVERLTEIFHEVKRVLRDDGTLWLNLGDKYQTKPPGNSKPLDVASGLPNSRENLERRRNEYQDMKKLDNIKEKDLIGLPWMVAFVLRNDGWYLRNDIIWHKPNPMPESVTDRCTTSHEHIFLMSKSKQYYYDQDAIREPHAKSTLRDVEAGYPTSNPGSKAEKRIEKGIHGSGGIGDPDKTRDELHNPKGRNKRDVWQITTKPFPEAHFAVYPPDLIRPCVKAGCPEDGIVLDPFFGAGTTGLVAKEQGCNYVGIELNEDYIEMAEDRLSEVQKALI